jgi:uncharacterized protein (TIGR03083 family)
VTATAGYRPAVELTPRYDGPPALEVVGPPDVLAPLSRQRRRLGELLAGLDDTEWATPSRCEGWTVRDVVAHLIGAEQFWALSVGAGATGEPTRFLVGFDPVATPAAMVDATRDQRPAEVLDGYRQASEALLDALAALEPDQWSLLTEAPPGHISIQAMAMHALWDGWIHERDVALPLGRTPVEEDDELRACLRYVAGLGPAFLATVGSERTGAIVVDGTDPDVHVVVEVGPTARVHDGEAPAGAVAVRGRTVELVEAMSFRAPVPFEVAEEDRWMFTGLAGAFDVAG